MRMGGERRRTWVSSCAAEVVVVGESSKQQPLVSDGLSAPETSETRRRQREIQNRGIILLVACAAYKRLKPQADQNGSGYPVPHVIRRTSHVTRHKSPARHSPRSCCDRHYAGLQRIAAAAVAVVH